jgi:hypothetical protein
MTYQEFIAMDARAVINFNLGYHSECENITDSEMKERNSSGKSNYICSLCKQSSI